MTETSMIYRHQPIVSWCDGLIELHQECDCSGGTVALARRFPSEGQRTSASRSPIDGSLRIDRYHTKGVAKKQMGLVPLRSKLWLGGARGARPPAQPD